MNILITGAFGFVGTNLSKALKTLYDCKLIAIDIKELDNHLYDVFYSWNDLERIDWSNMDIIIHLAGKAHDTNDTTEEKVYFDINVGLTKKILGYFLESGANKFIFFSSVKAVADSVQGDYLTEETLPKPQTPYGKSKLEAEKIILDAMEKWDNVLDSPGITKKKQAYILRPSMIHGPGNKGNLNLLFRLVQKRVPWPLGIYENNRSFVSIDNLNWVVKELIEKDIEPGIYQMADDETLSTNDLIALISDSQNQRTRIWCIPKKLIRVTAKAGDVLHLPLNSERLKKLTESYVVSNKKLKKALDTKKMQVSAKEGMKKTLKSFIK